MRFSIVVQPNDMIASTSELPNPGQLEDVVEPEI